MKDPYLIILDLDDTLMTGFTSYDEETFEYLRFLKDQGNIIMIATGRPFRSSHFVYEALKLDTPLINYNGARVTNPKDPNFPITDLRIDKDDLCNIIEHIRPCLINVFCEIIDDIYVMNYNEEIHPFLHVDGGVLHTGELKDILPGNPNGALFFLNEDYINIFENYIKNEYNGKLLTRYWKSGGYHIVEIYNPLVDKKRGFIDAIKYYNIKNDHTIAIGDGHNDIGLIQTAYIGVAMGNAHPELVKHAKYHTDTAKNQGVLKFLKKFFNEEKNTL